MEGAAEAKPNSKSPPIPPPQKVSIVSRGWDVMMLTSMKKYNRNQEPEAIPSRTPVDPQTLQIPDHLGIVKRPMDMSTIKRQLH